MTLGIRTASWIVPIFVVFAAAFVSEGYGQQYVPDNYTSQSS